MDSTVIFIILAIVAIFVLLFVFYFLEKYTKGESKTAAKPAPKDKPAETKPEAKPETKPKVAKEDDDVCIHTPEEELGEAPDQVVHIEDIEDIETVPEEDDIVIRKEPLIEERTRQKPRNRILDYHKNKWNPSDDYENSSSVDEANATNKDFELTAEDMQKILALRDLFDKKKLK